MGRQRPSEDHPEIGWAARAGELAGQVLGDVGDHQTTDRYELQTQSQETINEDFSIQAGINTSGRYGLTQVDTSLDSSLRQSRSESRSSSMNVAREIVSRAVERSLESTRRLRRLTITEEIRKVKALSDIPAEIKLPSSC